MAVRADDIEIFAGAVDVDRDRRLVLRHQRGDGEAFDELYRRYHGRLVSFCARRVGDRHTAEELAQEAFVKALRAMPTFAGERRFYPWMTVIAHRLCVDHHRRTARVEPSAEVDPGTVDADHDALFASVDRDHLDAALARVAPRHREVLELREQRGWSYLRIAEHLDVPVTTVEAVLHRARKALRREFLAVAGDDRRGRFGIGLLGGGVVARLKGWIAAATGPERWAPLLGTAAAGGLAVGIVAGPLTGGDDPARPVLDHPRGAVAPTTLVTPTPNQPVDVPAPPPAPASPGAPAGSRTAGTAASPRPAPAPAADLAVVGVYTGPEAQSWAEEENRGQPVHVPLGPVADVGLDPVQIVEDVLDPGGPP